MQKDVRQLRGNPHWHTFAEPIDEDELDRISKSQYLLEVILDDGCANIKRKWGDQDWLLGIRNNIANFLDIVGAYTASYPPIRAIQVKNKCRVMNLKEEAEPSRWPPD